MEMPSNSDLIPHTTENILTPGGYSFRVLSIGDAKQHFDLNWKSFDRVMKKIDPEGKLRDDKEQPITLLFDNRSFGQAVIDAIKGRTGIEELSVMNDIVRRIKHFAPKTVPQTRTIYVNTDDALFFEILGFRSLETILRHELKHLTHDKLWQKQQYQDFNKQYVSMEQSAILLKTIGGALLGISASNAIQELSKGIHHLENLLVSAGLLLVGAGFWKLSNKTVSLDPAEQEAMAAQNLYPKSRLFKTHPKHFLERLLTKQYSV